MLLEKYRNAISEVPTIHFQVMIGAKVGEHLGKCLRMQRRRNIRDMELEILGTCCAGVFLKEAINLQFGISLDAKYSTAPICDASLRE